MPKEVVIIKCTRNNHTTENLLKRLTDLFSDKMLIANQIKILTHRNTQKIQNLTDLSLKILLTFRPRSFTWYVIQNSIRITTHAKSFKNGQKDPPGY